MNLKNMREITKIKINLIKIFEIIDMGLISFQLSLKVKKNHQKRTIKLMQQVYISKIFTKYHLNKTNPINTQIKKTILESYFS